uniref:ras association domain-containing protein 4-like isoform X1 n=2 Tax=Myxine glutinosa TaxID=7769 RepID=UPI00358F8065
MAMRRAVRFSSEATSRRMMEEMENCNTTWMDIGAGKAITKSDLLNQLKMYNCYHEGKTLQLRYWEDERKLLIEGLLNISWGLRRPIRLQTQDDYERLQFSTQVQQISAATITSAVSRRGMACWMVPEESTGTGPQGGSSLNHQHTVVSVEMEPRLPRTKSDVSSLGRPHSLRRSMGDSQRIRRNRYSINGHFYNHKTSVFTPMFGSVTSVRVKSCMATTEVVCSLLKKFRVENEANEFALYIVHTTGEKRRLQDTEFPLIVRVLQGPSEKISRLFLMEQDLGEEITHDVAQYIHFEMPVLESFITKLYEEQEREETKLRKRYDSLRTSIEHRLQELLENGILI